MRISDWSSDVCSSDLIPVEQARLALKMQQAGASDAEIAATMERVRALTEEKKILQDIFGDQSDPTAEMRKGFEDLRNTIVDVSSTWGRAAATMVSGAENIAKANRFAGEAGKLSDRTSTRLNSSH